MKVYCLIAVFLVLVSGLADAQFFGNGGGGFLGKFERYSWYFMYIVHLLRCGESLDPTSLRPASLHPSYLQHGPFLEIVWEICSQLFNLRSKVFQYLLDPGFDRDVIGKLSIRIRAVLHPLPHILYRIKRKWSGWGPAYRIPLDFILADRAKKYWTPCIK